MIHASAIADSTLTFEPVGTWEVSPPPADGRLVLHINELHAGHKFGPPPATTYHAIVAKLDLRERPLATTVLPVEWLGDGKFSIAAPSSDHDKAVVAQFPPDCTLVPCELPASLD